jgi:hypothetical protein
MDYEQARHYVANTLKFGMKLGLDRMRALMNALGDPQNRLRFIHIAGTNGKGSTSMFAACSLACADFVSTVHTPLMSVSPKLRIIDGLAGWRLGRDEKRGIGKRTLRSDQRVAARWTA